MIEQYKIKRRDEIRSRPKYQGRDARDVPMATVNRELGCLKHMFTMAIKWGKAAHNPVKGVKLFKEENITQRILSDAEINSLQSACPEHTRDMIILALNTGMRRGEILNLKWEQVNLKQGYIIVIKTKSGKQRTIPLNRTALDMLRNRPKDGIFVYNNEGKPYGSVKKSLSTALRKLGLGHCRFHDLRHTFATRLVLAGVSLPVVKELLGHSTIEMTMRYAHPTPDSKRAAVDMLESQNAISDRHYMDTRPQTATPHLS